MQTSGDRVRHLHAQIRFDSKIESMIECEGALYVATEDFTLYKFKPAAFESNTT